LNSRTDLAGPESDVISRRRSDYASTHSNRLPQNANVAYDDYDVAWVCTKP